MAVTRDLKRGLAIGRKRHGRFEGKIQHGTEIRAARRAGPVTVRQATPEERKRFGLKPQD
jgi:hypothetical protein